MIATKPAFLGLFRRGGWCRMASVVFFRSAVNDLLPGAVIKLKWNQDPFQGVNEIMLESAENSHFRDDVPSWSGEDYPQIPGIPLWITLWVDGAEA
ncbi:hypothetical protein [Gluconacetobacter tumulicola]|uniref:Uncharacterized protein n=1 Tax=Gluconacetobacter tumulicola TaxID=1017177 RepID=A0A7W4P7N0_9PROT|nr:hypothetical protein [Gluconacetobacter tumulicola]MBB2180357.1 hypothetical protein [Gluconacetobacter tumulicola]